jgi:membrane-bound serine protease (ClpP class)
VTIRCLLWTLAVAALTPAAAPAAHINVVELSGTVNPATSEHLQTVIAQSESEGAVAVLLELDTPGGLLNETQEIIKAILNAEVPVIVYVAPRGAWAASAGTFITLAGHVAAMAPGTSIGAASPIRVGGTNEREGDQERTDVEMQKVEKFTTAFIETIAKQRKRNVEWAAKSVREAEAITEDEALELGVIDLVAGNRAELLEKIEGREVEVAGELQTLRVAGAELRELEMSAVNKFFNFLADPQVIALLLLAGALGLYMEFSQPGLSVPGVAGVLCWVLAFMALQIIPFSGLGLLLMAAGLGLMLAEIFVSSFGLLFTAGIACLLLGGSMLFDVPEVGDLELPFWSVLVPVVIGFSLFTGLVVIAVTRTSFRKQTAGVSELIGLVGRSTTGLEPEGTVFVRGEYWRARADEVIRADEPVEITAVEGLELRVRRASLRA